MPFPSSCWLCSVYWLLCSPGVVTCCGPAVRRVPISCWGARPICQARWGGSCKKDQETSRTVEAIRAYGAAHDGKLPPSLDDLPLPAPPEPFTGKPLDYQYRGKVAVLTGHDMPGLRYRLVIRFADKATP